MFCSVARRKRNKFCLQNTLFTIIYILCFLYILCNKISCVPAIEVEFATCGLLMSWNNWLYGLNIPIKAVIDGMNDGDQVRDVSVFYHVLYNQNVLSSHLVSTTQAFLIPFSHYFPSLGFFFGLWFS